MNAVKAAAALVSVGCGERSDGETSDDLLLIILMMMFVVVVVVVCLVSTVDNECWVAKSKNFFVHIFCFFQ